MMPAFRSASIAICLPGIASRVKRAATSATRPAPFVITMNWITIKIVKMTRPTMTEPPTTKLPKLSMTLPAYPWSRISRVTDTLSASRNNVAIKRYDGKIEKSRTRVVNIDASSASVAIAMFVTSNKSTSGVGNGTTIITTMPTIAAGIAIWPMRFGFTVLRS